MSDRTWILWGWWLFVLCAVLFIVAAVRSGDVVSLLGSLSFLAANVAFMIPVYRNKE